MRKVEIMASSSRLGLIFSEDEAREESPKRFGSTESRIETDDEETDGQVPSSSSSIGVPDDNDDDCGISDDEEDGVVSSHGSSILNSLDSLEDALPIKRGLSNFFSGKSKSFANLSEVTTVIGSVKEIEKVENPFNKKRRILLANRWATASKKSSFYAWRNPKSMPLLALDEDPREEDDEDNDDADLRSTTASNPRAFISCVSSSSSSSLESKLQQDPDQDTRWASRIPLTTQSCCSLSDLQ